MKQRGGTSRRLAPRPVEYLPDLLHAAATTRGLKRAENEDAYGVFSFLEPVVPGSKGHLFVVADGMGGHDAGREAAELAVRVLSSAYYADPATDPTERLERAFDMANRRVRDMALSSGQLGAGTTLSALVVKGDQAWVAHVGDSRIYRVRPLTIAQLTVDHTFVAELVREGVLDPEQAARHPKRNLLTRAVGAQPALEVDVDGPFRVHPGDRFLLTTDGLNVLEPVVISATLRNHEPQMACDLLIQLANTRGGRDNATAVLAMPSVPVAVSVSHAASRLGDGA